MSTTFPAYADITTNKTTVRPHHLRQMAAMMDDADDAVLADDITATKAAIETLFDALIATHAGEPTFQAELETLFSDTVDAIDAGIQSQDDYFRSTLLTKADDFDSSNAAITELDNEDARCRGTGRVPGLTLDSAISDGSYRDCPSCGGVGRTEETNSTPSVTWPVQGPDWINNLS